MDWQEIRARMNPPPAMTLEEQIRAPRLELADPFAGVPEDTLLAQYGPAGVPARGTKGYRDRPLDGRDPSEVAATALKAAERLNESGELMLMVDPEWWADWQGDWWWPESERELYPEDWEEARQDQEDLIQEALLAEFMDIPARGINGNLATQEERSDFAHEMLHLAAQVRSGIIDPYHTEWIRKLYGATPLEMPSWLAMAAVADRLVSTDKKGFMVNVPRDVAYDYVKKVHSKLGKGYKLPPGTMYAIGLVVKGRLVAVALAGAPTGRWSSRTDPKNVLELTRVASDGTHRNAASKLTARMIKLLEFSKRGDPKQPALFVTYSFADEPGTPYKALKDLGLRPVARVAPRDATGARGGGAGGRSEVEKIRWEAGPAALPARWHILDERPEQLGLL
jgi:hypothetical protein